MLNFLKYISDKELTGSEYIVLTIIYKDTRYGNGCYKSIRQFLDHTPFTASKTTISSTINSLVEKGYVEREYDKNLDAIFLTAKGVNCEKVVKLPYELKIEKASESLPVPQTKKVAFTLYLARISSSREVCLLGPSSKVRAASFCPGRS